MLIHIFTNSTNTWLGQTHLFINKTAAVILNNPWSILGKFRGEVSEIEIIVWVAPFKGVKLLSWYRLSCLTVNHTPLKLSWNFFFWV